MVAKDLGRGGNNILANPMIETIFRHPGMLLSRDPMPLMVVKNLIPARGMRE